MNITITFPIHTALIAAEQEKYKELIKKVVADKAKHFTVQTIEQNDVTLYKGKIYIPKSIAPRTLAWYHEYLCHPGANRTEQTLRCHLYWASLPTPSDIANIAKYVNYKKNKEKNTVYCPQKRQNTNRGPVFV